jgi:hypothetical protein
MIQPLRRVHRRAFFVLAIALPVILFIGLRGRHAITTNTPARAASSGRLEKLP